MEIIKLDKLTFDKDDKLDRKKYAVNLTNYLLSSKDNQKVICVNSSWGTGKTWFVNMWINMIKGEQPYNESIIPIYYNAWENDDFENSFIPLIGEINNQLFKENKAFNKDKIKKAAGAILKDAAINVIKKATADIVDLKTGIEELTDENLYEKYTTEYIEKSKARTTFSREMQNYAVSIKKKIFIFIDELDRCRPTFALETLERIKHFFDIENIFFILLLDKEQLGYSVKTLYGNDCDTIGYLMRFIDVEFKLPEISSQRYFKIKKYNQTNFEVAIGKLLNLFDLSLRDIDKLIIWENALISGDKSISSGLRFDLQLFFAYFLILKLKYSDLYKKVLNNTCIITYDDLPQSKKVDESTFQWEQVHIIKMFFKIRGLYDYPTESESEKSWLQYLKENVLDLDRKLSMLDYYDLA